MMRGLLPCRHLSSYCLVSRVRSSFMRVCDCVCECVCECDHSVDHSFVAIAHIVLCCLCCVVLCTLSVSHRSLSSYQGSWLPFVLSCIVLVAATLLCALHGGAWSHLAHVPISRSVYPVGGCSLFSLLLPEQVRIVAFVLFQFLGVHSGALQGVPGEI